MRFRYDGELTFDPVLGRLEPGMIGEGPDDVVLLKIQAGLLTPVEEPAPEESRPSRAARRRREEPGPAQLPPDDGY